MNIWADDLCIVR